MLQVPGFEIIGKVGEGALTEVWGAYQRSLDRRVNLRLLKPEFAGDPSEVGRFIHEAQRAASLRHPNIVCIYNVNHHDGTHFVIMEHADGPSVHELILQRGRLSADKAADIALHVAQALDYAWREHRLIHRAVSPGSIRVEADGTVKFGYIGLSLQVDPGSQTFRDSAGCIEGIPYYMSPEQARGEHDLDCRTDMYGLGATLYHMVTGRMPFQDFAPVDALRQQETGTLPNPATGNPGVSPGLAFVMSKLMRKRREDRYPSWREAIRELGKATSGHMFFRRPARLPASTIDMGAKSRRAGRPRIVVRKSPRP